VTETWLLKFTCDMWILSATNLAVVPVYIYIAMEGSLVGGNRVTRQFFLACPQRSLCVLLGHSVLVHESFEYCTFFGGAFCVAHRALLNAEFVHNCRIEVRIYLRGLRWNASLMRLTFSSEVHDFQEILHATDYL
jgi:hypothetical protein